MEQVLLAVLEQRAAHAVDDAFRHAGRARGIHHVERGIERNPFKRRGGAGLPEGTVIDGAADAGEVGPLGDIWNDDDAFDRRQPFQCAANGRQRIERLAVVEVAVGREQYPGRDLSEPVQDAVDAEVRGAGSPRRAEARRGEHGDHALRQVGNESGDAIARSDAEFAQASGDAPDLGVQLPVADLTARAALIAEHQRHVVVAAREQVLREIESSVLEPRGAGHAVAVLHDGCLSRRADHAGEVHHGRPELRALIHRPAPQGLVVAHCGTVALARVGREPRQVGVGHARGRGCPDRVGHARPPTCSGSWVPTRPRAWSR